MGAICNVEESEFDRVNGGWGYNQGGVVQTVEAPAPTFGTRTVVPSRVLSSPPPLVYNADPTIRKLPVETVVDAPVTTLTTPVPTTVQQVPTI